MYNPFCKKMFLAQLPAADVAQYKEVFRISEFYEEREKKDLYQFNERQESSAMSLLAKIDTVNGKDAILQYLHWIGEDAAQSIKLIQRLDCPVSDVVDMSKYFSSFEEFHQTLESVYQHLDVQQEAVGIMDRCVANLFWCRLSTDEIALLKKDDVDTEKCCLHIRNKYGEEREISFNPILSDLFEQAKKASDYVRKAKSGADVACSLEVSDYFIRYLSVGKAITQEADRETSSQTYTRKLLSRYSLLMQDLNKRGIIQDLGRSIRHADVVWSSRFCTMYELEKQLQHDLMAKDVISLNVEFNKATNRADAGRMLRRYRDWKKYYSK